MRTRFGRRAMELDPVCPSVVIAESVGSVRRVELFRESGASGRRTPARRYAPRSNLPTTLFRNGKDDVRVNSPIMRLDRRDGQSILSICRIRGAYEALASSDCVVTG